MEQLTLKELKDLEKVLAENKRPGPWYAIMNTKIWNGYWKIDRTIPFFRRLGRKLHSRKIYWLGFQIRWVQGIKEWYVCKGEVK